MASESICCIKKHESQLEIKDVQPYKSPMYNAARKFISKVQRRLDELIQLGIIEEMPTDFINPLVVVRMNNGDIQICLDATGGQRAHGQGPEAARCHRRVTGGGGANRNVLKARHRQGFLSDKDE